MLNVFDNIGDAPALRNVLAVLHIERLEIKKGVFMFFCHKILSSSFHSLFIKMASGPPAQ